MRFNSQAHSFDATFALSWLLISPRKAQLLYYDRSVIIISEAFNILDTHNQPTDILIAMLLGFSVIPPNSGVPSFLSQE